MSTLRKALYFDKRFVDKPWEVVIEKEINGSHFWGYFLSKEPFGEGSTISGSCGFYKKYLTFIGEIQPIPSSLKEEYKVLFT